jgi:hypothetical protein
MKFLIVKSLVIATFTAVCTLTNAATLVHRYSFSGNTDDSVGGNTGILDSDATVDENSLILTGLGVSIDANRMSFTDPVDIGENFGDTGVSIETWYTDTGTSTWGKLFQFGQNEAGFEIAYTHTRGNGEQSGVDRGGAKLFGEQISQNEEHHLVITVSTDGDLNTWVDGEMKLIDVPTTPVADIGFGGGENFEAIGATSWNDPGMNGSVNEFRIWEGELSGAGVAASILAGPDVLPNADDSDGDGLPDAWEENWFGDGNLEQGADDDPDMDELTNAEELAFSAQLNPNKADSDDDGLNDGPEVKTYLTNPLNADTDGDTLTDGAEVNTHMTSPLLVDTDMDFFTDGNEIANNTDPNDPNDPGTLTTVELAHRYSFTTGAEVDDAVGGNTGVLTNGAVVEDNQLQLDGAGSGQGATSMRFTDPIDFGANFGATGLTIETWYTDSGSGIWAKLFTFGTSQAGQEIAWTNFRGGDDLAPGLDRNGAHPIESIPFGSDERLTEDEEHHLVVSVDPDGTTNLWIDGEQEIFEIATNEPSNIVTSTESIGSTAWNDPGHSGSVNEFRIWRGPLGADEVAANFAAGPDVTVGSEAFAITKAVYDEATGAVDITWNSVPGRTYAIDVSPNLSNWTEVDDGIVATDTSTTFRDTPPAATRVRYYRVKDIDL